MRTVTSLIALSILTACKSHDGIYMPDCIAYEGDTVELHSGRFEWDRFTDQVRLDDDEQPVDPFPDYPKAGSYSVTNGEVTLVADDGSTLPDMQRVEHDGRSYLLTAAQAGTWRASGTMPDCALVLGGHIES